jgi:hypothetical protein
MASEAIPKKGMKKPIWLAGKIQTRTKRERKPGKERKRAIFMVYWR